MFRLAVLLVAALRAALLSRADLVIEELWQAMQIPKPRAARGGYVGVPLQGANGSTKGN
jgi:hypothetical protein